MKILQETVHNECLERQELHEKLEETRDELLKLKKNACNFFHRCHFYIFDLFNNLILDSSQQLIPINASINQSNFSTFKNGTGLIDANNIQNQSQLLNRIT